MNQYCLPSFTHQLSQQNTQIQSQSINKICNKNLQTFGIVLTDKIKVKYAASQLERIDLGNGWYCYATDNRVKSSQTVITMHGAPGNHKEWAGLQTEMNKYCRWINFIIPGFDNQDERRGSYIGTLQQFGQLFQKLLHHKNIQKVVLCSHSFSTSIAPYLLQKYPSTFEGYINVAGMTNKWSIGFMVMYYLVVAQQKYYEEVYRKNMDWDYDEERHRMYGKFIKKCGEYNFGQFGVPHLTETQFFSFMKLSLRSPYEIDEYFIKIKQYTFLRVSLYGTQDHFHYRNVVEQTLYNASLQSDNFKTSHQYKSIVLANKELQNRLRRQFGIEIEGDKIQSYFVFLFDKTGHAVHRRRPVQVSRIIKIYLTCLEVIAPYRLLSKTKL